MAKFDFEIAGVDAERTLGNDQKELWRSKQELTNDFEASAIKLKVERESFFASKIKQETRRFKMKVEDVVKPRIRQYAPRIHEQ